MASDRALLCDNVAASVSILSTKKRYSSVLKGTPVLQGISVFQKICFEVKELKTYKISSDCHMRTFQFLSGLF